MPISQSYLEQVFNNAILAENPNLSPSLEQGQDLYFKRKAITQVVASSTQENLTVSNNIFPVSSSSTLLYQHAANLGIPLITGALPSYGTARLAITTGTISPVDFTVLQNTVFTNSITGVQYQVTTNILITTGTDLFNVNIPIQSILTGSATYASPGTNLTISTPYQLSPSLEISTAIINNDFVAGQVTPTDYHVSNLVYEFMQNPRGGGSEGDYYKWALQSSNLITQAKIIPTGGIVSNQNFLLVAIMGGSSDPNININLGYPISRSSSLATISICNNYINGVRPVNDNAIVITVSTFGLDANTPNYVTQIGLLDPRINLTVALADGLTLDTSISGANGDTKTVREWILYQFRYAILSMPYTGVIYDGNPFLLGEQITTLLSNGLGSSQSFNGYLCSILVNATFTYSDNNVSNSANIPVPNSNQYYLVGNPTTLNIIYDIDTSIIDITVV